jgi:hypothetical protein
MTPSTTAESEPATTTRAKPVGSRRVLCAYSPRWLSGPTPRYRGLCPTWEGDEPTGQHPAARSN